MVNIIEKFIEYCTNMTIAVEERLDLPNYIRKDKRKLDKLSEAVDDLLTRINEDPDKELKHAIEKHLDYKSARKHFEEGKKVSYFVKGAKLREWTRLAISRSRNDIIMKLYDGSDDITITYGFEVNIGKVHFGVATDNDDKLDKDVNAMRMGIEIVKVTKKDVPILRVKSSYPIPDSERINKRNY